MFTNPKYTLVLLDLLKPSDEELQAIHHMGNLVDVRAHRAYCERTKRFQACGGNARVAEKLEAMLIERVRSLAV